MMVVPFLRQPSNEGNSSHSLVLLHNLCRGVCERNGLPCVQVQPALLLFVQVTPH